jgi:two-component system, NtrC family, response regulator HydG
MNTVLVVDDKEMMRDSVGSTLQRAGFKVVTAGDGEAALEAVARRRPDAVVTDLKMPGLGGLELLERLRGIDDDLPVVLMTAFGTVDTAVQAIKLGAFDYITKPFEGDELIIAVKRAIQHAQLVRENAVLRLGGEGGAGDSRPGLRAGAGEPTGLDRLIGESPAMRTVKEQILAVAESHGTVLVVGESGSGKEVVARAVHDLSPRQNSPFLALNCAALSESLLESELFGHEKGAFTGADRLRKGRFELADGGTLLLDEVSEIGQQVQAKLLRVLQERAFERVGSSMTIGVDVRVIATSNRDLPRSVSRGEFRQDLFFRLNVLPIHLPPLRDRLEDVPALAGKFAQLIGQREGRPAAVFDEGALGLMQSYHWPGNVRELQNICERAVVLSAGRRDRQDPTPVVIGRGMLEPWLNAGWLGGSGGGGGMGTGLAAQPLVMLPALQIEPKGDHGGSLSFVVPSGRTLEEIERETILQTLGRFNGHRLKTARALGIGVRTLGLKLKKWKEMQLVEQTV